MTSTPTPLDGADRHAITVTVQNHRTTARDDQTVHQFTVETADGATLSLFALDEIVDSHDAFPADAFPADALPADATTEGTTIGAAQSWTVGNLLASAVPASVADVEGHCPACSGDVRPGCQADAVDPAIAAAALDARLDGRFGVIDTRTTLTVADAEGDVIDDWHPMHADRQVGAPAAVCTDCGRTYTRREIQRKAPLGTDEHAESREVNLIESAPMERVNASVMDNAAAPTETLGMATGGATDVENFRANVDDGYTPQPAAVSDEGLFYDYHFETGTRDPTDTEALFSPRYATAASEHPLTGETERFVSVGLDSSLSASAFERPRLDLVAVLDVSGSMSSPFDAYYYDEHGRKHESNTARTDAEPAETKLEAASTALCALTEQLDDDDRLGVVLYNSRAHLAKPLRDVASTDMDAIRRHIREVQAGGGTNLEDGFEAAVDLLQDGATTEHVERRVVFMTDMMPNTGETGESALVERFEHAADHGIHTTFVGMGLDENAALADALSSVRGANHYFVHSTAEFQRRLGDEFDYMVTPLVYDLSLDLDAGDDEIAAVHGAPAAAPETGRLLDVGTLFPSAKADGEARGGVVLVRLDTAAATTQLELEASWTERDGTEAAEQVTITLPEETPHYDHAGIRKAVALSRYARELRRWARAVHQDDQPHVDDWLLSDDHGEHERESIPLRVSSDHAARFEDVRAYLAAEQASVGDETLAQERELLDTLIGEATGSTPGREVTE